MIATLNETEYTLCRDWAYDARPPRVRTMREFAESELVIPTGPYQGHRFRVDRQPFTGLLLDLMDDERWGSVWITGSMQAGKSTIGHTTPILYHLFEQRETVVAAAPDDKVIADKWAEDLLPMLEQTRFREHLPKRGGGSNAGRVAAVRFGNGATLRFMTGGGSGKSRASFTARVLCVTETEAFDVTGGQSREATKLDQLIGRLRAFTRRTGRPSRIYCECTLEHSKGRTWVEYERGTRTRIACPCARCGAWVTPERDSLIGWKDAETEGEARERSRWTCPECKTELDESERDDMNRRAVAVHRGQTVSGPWDRVTIEGDPPATDSLGFRWNAFNNLFVGAADVGAEEWRGAQEEDEANAEKRLRQWVWALPYDPPRMDLSGISWAAIARRSIPDRPRGVIPTKAVRFAAAIDLGDRLCYWVALAELDDETIAIADYGVQEVPRDELGLDDALPIALSEFADTCRAGWALGETGGRLSPAVVLMDSGSGAHTQIVYTFVARHGEPYRAAKGFGSLQERRYYRPSREGSGDIVGVGDGYHATVQAESGIWLWRLDADVWKTRVHDGLKVPTATSRAIALYTPAGTWRDHTSIAKHLTAERQVREFSPARGFVTRWELVASRPNHYLDAVAMGLAALRMSPRIDAKPRQKRRLASTNERPFLASDRR